jgi:Family of unknown function (DUF5994)
MTITDLDRMAAVSLTEPSTPRLRLQPAGTRYSLLDGAWWPRSTDPVAELPGLVLAIDALQGPVTRLMLHAPAWTNRPRRLAVAGRVVRLGYFASQPPDLLIAVCGSGGARVDLLTVPPGAAREIAETAMTRAATAGNQMHAHDIVAAATTRHRDSAQILPEDTWETEGGHLAADPRSSSTPGTSTR